MALTHINAMRSNLSSLYVDMIRLLDALFDTEFTLEENDLKASYLDHRARFLNQLKGN